MVTQAWGLLNAQISQLNTMFFPLTPVRLREPTLALCLTLLGLLSACNPTLNWRTVQLAGFEVSALWPCKPDRAERPVPLEQHTLHLHMLSCDAAGHTFAWGAMQVPAGVQAQTLAQAWQHASVRSLNAKAEQSVTAWTPVVRSGLHVSGWRAQGVRHDGKAITAHAVVLQHRNELHQLVIYGDPTSAVIASWTEGIEAK